MQHESFLFSFLPPWLMYRFRPPRRCTSFIAISAGPGACHPGASPAASSHGHAHKCTCQERVLGAALLGANTLRCFQLIHLLRTAATCATCPALPLVRAGRKGQKGKTAVTSCVPYARAPKCLGFLKRLSGDIDRLLTLMRHSSLQPSVRGAIWLCLPSAIPPTPNRPHMQGVCPEWHLGKKPSEVSAGSLRQGHRASCPPKLLTRPRPSTELGVQVAE